MPRHNFIKMIVLMAVAFNGIACFGYPYNFGSVWNQWNNEARMAYMWGFQDGSSQAYLATAKFVFKLDSIPTKQPIKLRKITNAIQLKHRHEDLVATMTELYRDERNCNIWLEKMVFLADKKLSGIDITNELDRTRKWANEQ